MALQSLSTLPCVRTRIPDRSEKNPSLHESVTTSPFAHSSGPILASFLLTSISLRVGSIVILDFYLGGTLSLEWRYRVGPEEGRNMSATLL